MTNDASENQWNTETQDTPPVQWDGDRKCFVVTMTMNGMTCEAEWRPDVFYVVRIRETGTGDWSVGFVTPLTGCEFDGLKPNTEYELEVRAKNDAGVSEPVFLASRTLPDGRLQDMGRILNEVNQEAANRRSKDQ